MKNNNQELEVNKQHREEYEQLMDESSTKLDGYWDKNNWFVRLLLLILLVIIIAGSIWIISSYVGTLS